jgi:hypothetical protein
MGRLSISTCLHPKNSKLSPANFVTIPGVDDKGRTVGDYMARNGHIEMAEYLLQQDFDISARDSLA